MSGTLPPLSGRWLVVVAHPDDEVLGCGALLRRLDDVDVVHVTDGAPRDGDDARRHGFADPPAYAAARWAEARASLDLAGIPASRHHGFGVADQGAAHCLTEVVRRLVPIVARADVVLTHAYEGGHPDHDAVAFAAHAAIRLAGGPARPIVEMPFYHAGPEGWVRQRFLPHPGAGAESGPALTEDEVALKARMAACHATQGATLAGFALDREPLRRAPSYDFTVLPHGGDLLYERHGWGLDRAGWRTAVRAAEAELDFEFGGGGRVTEARPLTVLSVAYPLARVSADSTGGAEQVLATLDRALVAAGHRSVVVAPEGSRVEGDLEPIAWTAGPLDEAARAEAQAANRAAVARVLARERVDVVHLHGIDFDRTLPEPGPAVLATLHLPPDWYPAEALRPARPRTWLNCVSAAQHAACPATPNLLSPVENGIAVARFAARHARRGFALFLGRICPEKGVHLALRAAHRAGVSLIVAGELYPYAAHRDYFDAEVAPLLDARRRFVGPVGFARKRRLLTAARCLLVPSLAAETSSLVAREAAACGTPVVAFPNGALADAVRPGETGFLVDGVDAMADAIAAAGTIDPEACRAAARTRFDERRMVAGYLAHYRAIAGSGA